MKKIIYIFAIMLFALVSCDKEELTITDSTKVTEKEILTFATQEEFEQTLAKVNAMTNEERLLWEKEQGFKSFGTICDEYYASLDPKDYKTFDELKSKLNHNFSNLYEEDGSYFLEPKLLSDGRRYLMGERRMIIVADNALKVFDKGDIVTSINNIDLLMNQKSYSLAINELAEDKVVMKTRKIDENTSKVKIVRQFSENKSYMLRLHVALWQFAVNLGIDGFRRELFCIIQNYERFLGVYWITGLPTQCNVNIVAKGNDGVEQSISLNGLYIIRSSFDNDLKDIGTKGEGGVSVAGSSFFYKIETFNVNINNSLPGRSNCKIEFSDVDLRW
jgi:hypothetical protein